jgi:hypothetical protein
VFFQTGIDQAATGIKKVSILAFPFFSFYRIVKEKQRGRKIYLVPSHRVLIRNLPSEIKEEKEARKYLEEEILSFLKGRTILWKIWWEKEKGRVLLAEPEGELKKNTIWDAEPVALARAFLSLGFKEGEVWDFGKRKITQVKIEKGCILDFKAFFEEIPSEASIPAGLPVLLSGGRSYSKEVLELFKEAEVKRIPFISAEKVSAFGAALWGVVGKELPSLSSTFAEYDPKTLTKFSIALSISLGFTLLAWGGIKLGTPLITKKLKLKQKEIFKQVYPNTPVVSPLTQIKIMIKEFETPGFYDFFAKILKSLPKEAKLLSIDYDGISFKVKVEAKEEVAKDLPGKISSVKKLPGGSEIIELELSSGDI